MEYPKNLTKIGRIGIIKKAGDEFSTYTKKFIVDELPDFAAIKVDSHGVCGIWLNGEFLEASPGRYFNRITYVECTSKINIGENIIRFELGGHFYPHTEEKIYAQRGARISHVAAELELRYGDSASVINTDTSWECISNGEQVMPQCFSEVTKAEYERFWKVAALWCEPKPLSVPEAVAAVAGEGYKAYVSKPFEKYISITNIHSLNRMSACDDGSIVTFGGEGEDAPYVIYDVGRLHMGYIEMEYDAEDECSATFFTDYTEDVIDFDENNEKWYASGIVRKMLPITMPLKKGKNNLFITRIRGFHYLKVRINGSAKVSILNTRLRLSMMPYTKLGYFKCDDEMFNKMWEVGKYTLHVNKHREYESCPRSEKKYFSGDGVIDALVDLYAFGEDSLLDSSFAITEFACDGGIRSNRYDRNQYLWDYPAWRIITTYYHYLYTADLDFIKRYYHEFKTNIEWMTDKMSSNYLMYQYPTYSGSLFQSAGDVEFTCSFDRLGEKPMLNALFYKSLLCMSEFGELIGDKEACEWKDLAEKVCEAFNERLWSETDGAYLDTFDPTYIPQDGNALALLFGIAKGERAKTVMNTLCRENWSEYGSALMNKECSHTHDCHVISPVTNMYEAEGRFLLGDADSAVELIKRTWGTMLAKGAETFWEYTHNNATERWHACAHAWSSGCTYLLSAYVMGIRPAEAGYEKILFAPYEKFESFNGVVPTAKGLVAVRCETVNGTRHYTLAIPRGAVVESKLHSGATLEIIEY